MKMEHRQMGEVCTHPGLVVGVAGIPVAWWQTNSRVLPLPSAFLAHLPSLFAPCTVVVSSVFQDHLLPSHPHARAHAHANCKGKPTPYGHANRLTRPPPPAHPPRPRGASRQNFGGKDGGGWPSAIGGGGRGRHVSRPDWRELFDRDAVAATRPWRACSSCQPVGSFDLLVCIATPRAKMHGWTTSVCWTLVWWWMAGVLHELAHLTCAMALCPYASWCCWENVVGVLQRNAVHVKDAKEKEEKYIRHVGWVVSLVLAVIVLCLSNNTPHVRLAFCMTAVEAFSTDAWGWKQCRGVFRCGNFGLVVLSDKNKQVALDIIRAMVSVTMIRGAQAGGVLTYRKGKGGLRGIRSRVAKGKRQDLSVLLDKKVRRAIRFKALVSGPRVYIGHTRFATTSIATLPGTHPHIWCPGQIYSMWTGLSTGCFENSQQFIENHITHNGDFDFFTVAGQMIEIGRIQSWLEKVTGISRPCSVDSVAIAGLMDVLHTRGVWFLSLRFAFLFSTPYNGLDLDPPTKACLAKLAAMADAHFGAFIASTKCDEFTRKVRQQLCQQMEERLGPALMSQYVLFDEERAALTKFMETAITAFLEHDLFCSSNLFFRNARGSFGLCTSSTVSAHRQVVIAARGQSMSVAFYPRMGLVLYGSQQAAVKASIGIAEEDASDPMLKVGQRLDLDDLGGELCLLDWGQGQASSVTKALKVETIPSSGVNVYFLEENLVHFEGFEKRLVPLQDNPLVLPLPQKIPNPVCADIMEIPKALSRIQDSFVHSSESLNRFSAWTLARKIDQRMNRVTVSPNDVDILLTGCEVSLWAAEQFASDLGMVFPNIITKVISANKLLGLKGQNFPHHALGSNLNEHWILEGTIVIVVSHSGETFGSLAVCNLLRPLTKNIFVVTSEWDTQIGKQLRKIDEDLFHANVFSTELGLRTAEPCTITVAATHHLMTQILLYLMEYFHAKDRKEALGSNYTSQDMTELQRNNMTCLSNLEEIIGPDLTQCRRTTPTSAVLRGIGRKWAWHVLELPVAWILSAAYIIGTVTAGYPLIYGICVAAGLPETSSLTHLPLFFDSLLYVFVAQWTTLLIRLIQGRALLHRISTRTVVIADTPWVAQSAEAFLSKVFATSFTNTCINVHSGNPADHLVHRFTHRVVRGTLVACGRPDGRLSSLTALENSVCLSVNQASSIQHYGVTCESITIGHNPTKLPLAAESVYLPSKRPDYICERLLKLSKGMEPNEVLSDMSSSQLLGEYETLVKEDRLQHASRSSEDSSLEDPPKQAATAERYFGEALKATNPDASAKVLIESQNLSMLLYETRIASLQRLVAFFVMFYELGHTVQQFWKHVSFGLLTYDMSSTHSVMRVATTASPVSAADIREQLLELEKEKQEKVAQRVINDAMLVYLNKRRLARRQNFK